MKDHVWAVVACLSLGILSGCNSQKQAVSAAKATPTPTPTPVEAQPLFTPQAATLAQQKMCDEQAGKKFHENRPDKGSYESDYTSHYDPTVNVCYIRIHSIGAKPPSVSDVVYDAFGGRIFANYMWINSENKKYWEVSPMMCEIHIPGKPDETCKSDTQFDELTEKYFGVTQ
jgi:hypothetical protein